MFVIDNAALPAEAITPKPAPFIEIFKSGLVGKVAPVLGIDYEALYEGTGLEFLNPVLIDPLYVGRYYRIELPFALDSILNIANYSEVDDPIDLLPNRYWVDKQYLNLYSKIDISSIQVEAIAILDVPSGSVDYKWLFDVSGWGSFTPIAAESGGQVFNYTAGTPSAGEFSVDSGELLLQGNPTILPNVGDCLYVRGTFTVNTGAMAAAIATYDGITPAEDENLAYVEFCGKAFTPAEDVFAPGLYSFLWNRSMLSIFIDPQLRIGLNDRAVKDEYTLNAVFSTTYTRQVEITS
jgi:hypothetical protein